MYNFEYAAQHRGLTPDLRLEMYKHLTDECDTVIHNAIVDYVNHSQLVRNSTTLTNLKMLLNCDFQGCDLDLVSSVLREYALDYDIPLCIKVIDPDDTDYVLVAFVECGNFHLYNFSIYDAPTEMDEYELLSSEWEEDECDAWERCGNTDYDD